MALNVIWQRADVDQGRQTGLRVLNRIEIYKCRHLRRIKSTLNLNSLMIRCISTLVITA
jgi:hypothetical protein